METTSLARNTKCKSTSILQCSSFVYITPSCCASGTVVKPRLAVVRLASAQRYSVVCS